MIQLGPKGLTGGLKRVLNLLVEEISLVDKAATRRKFVLIKRDAQSKPFEVAKEELRRINSMGFKETMEFESTEELSPSPGIKRRVALAAGYFAKGMEILSSLGEFKEQVKYKYKEPSDEDDDDDEDKKKKKDKTNAKKKEDDDDDKDDEVKKNKKKDLTQDTKGKDDAEVSAELKTKSKELSDLLASEDSDKDEIQKKIDEIEKIRSGSGGGK